MELQSIRTWEQDGKWSAIFTAPDAVRISTVEDTEQEAIDHLVRWLVELYSQRCEELNRIRQVLGVDIGSPPIAAE
jgi:hypothetical protein